MLASDEKPVRILNDLIIVNNDCIEGFNYASKEADADILRILFNRLTATSVVCKTELTNEVYKLGGEPGGILYVAEELTDAWEDVREAIAYKDHLTLLRSCEQKEATIIKLYENVINCCEEDITSQHHKLFHRHHELLNADHNRIKNLLNVLLKAV